jgi:hypothetical protein
MKRRRLLPPNTTSLSPERAWSITRSTSSATISRRLRLRRPSSALSVVSVRWSLACCSSQILRSISDMKSSCGDSIAMPADGVVVVVGVEGGGGGGIGDVDVALQQNAE